MDYRNWDTYKRIHIELREYMEAPHSGLLFDGRNGLPMFDDALLTAAGILNTTVERLHLHPDYLLVEPPEDRSSMGVEESMTILEKIHLVPSLANYNVVVINHMEAMTEQAQNKLLKLIEDNAQVIVLGVIYGKGILPTIRSRMRCINYPSMPQDDFISCAMAEGIDETTAAVMFFLEEGCPDPKADLTSLISLFLEVKDAVMKQDYKKLFYALHLVKEKDDDSFYASYPSKVSALFKFIGSLILEQPISADDVRRLNIISKHMAICSESWYTKDLFFQAIAQIQ